MSTNPEQIPPPAGEEIHLPGPSLLPILNAAGLTLTIIGITLGWVLLVGGGILFLVTLVMWIVSTKRDIAHLPPDHSSH